MQLARQRLTALQQELAGIQETGKEMGELTSQLDALQENLDTVKKPFTDLKNMGVKRNALLFERPPNSVIDEEHLDSLCTQIRHIHRHVSMKPSSGARMILDAILLAVAQICVDGGAQLPVAILPELRVTPNDGVLIENPATKHQVWLTGNTDYGMCVYKNKEHRSGLFHEGSISQVMAYVKSYVIIVEAKWHDGDESIEDRLPEATGQAVALAEVTNKPVRYCLSNGTTWIFSLFTKDANGKRVACVGTRVNIRVDNIDDAEDLFKRDVRRVVELLHHWDLSSLSLPSIL
ncbi:hypothetical protein GY45DRAFT_1337949 [Cubamyces sp. BRFM 1775]|nr:hypothetical protein GY45DRAFT_1337949 [Cubamyces sp. BRFM 1775]